MNVTSEADEAPVRGWYRLRISVRTTMLIVLVIAALLGWQADRIRKQRRAVEAVRQYGGWVHYDYEFGNGKLAPGRSPWAPPWLRRVLGDELFQAVRQVNLVYGHSSGKRSDNSNVQACDELIKTISALPGLEELLLKDTQATDEGLRYIGRMTDLEKLYIWNARSLTDAGVAHLSNLKNLTTIHIDSANLTDESLAILSNLPRIEELALQQNDFSDAGLARLRGENRLKRLYIGMGRGRITDAGLVHLKGFEKLEILDLQRSEVTASGLEELKGLPSLKAIWLSGTHLSAPDVQGLQEAMPGVKITN